jgi:hypothetical protein
MKILDSFFRAVLGYIAMWLNAKNAERLETKVKQMESAERSKEVEKKVAEQAKATDVSSPSAWNRGAGVVILFCVLACGCVKYVESRWPMVPATPRPTVPEEPKQWADRENIIAGYAAQLEGVVRAHNEAVRKHNADNGYED